jgi:exocyst complex component 7
VDQLRDAIEEAVARGDEAVRRVEVAVGFLGWTKAAGRAKAVATLRAVSRRRLAWPAWTFTGIRDGMMLIECLSGCYNAI